MRICDQLCYFPSFISQEVPCYLYGNGAEGRKDGTILSTDQENDGGMLCGKTLSSLIIDVCS